jgi:hypothetical protein
MRQSPTPFLLFNNLQPLQWALQGPINFFGFLQPEKYMARLITFFLALVYQSPGLKSSNYVNSFPGL